MTLTDLRSALQEGLGLTLDSPILIEETSDTYPIKLDAWENWFPFAYLAFQKLDSSNVKSFATIGTGSGADALGALHTFRNLDTLVITDVDEKVVQIAKGNIQKHAGNINLIALIGSLCQPLRENGLKVDLLYENLPNIPDTTKVTGNRRSSRYAANSFRVNNELAQAYLLESHLAFLAEAKESLTSDGSVICSIGGRVPCDLLRALIESSGYHFKELVAGFKLQTEPEEVLPGYSEAEQGAVKFDFYRYAAAVQFLESRGMTKPFVDLSGDELKELLVPFRISAHEALALYRHDPTYRIGHTVHMIRGYTS